jgi:hypothetical protein
MSTSTTTISGPTVLDPAAVSAFAATLRGPVIGPSDPAYDQARAVYNGMIDKHPALIARCADVADVIAAVGFAREHKLLLAVRGGGHNGPGLGTCDDGLVIDLSSLRGVRVDPQALTVRVGGGTTWGEVDHATHAFDLATPSGFISTTGVGGLTLGGGVGYLTRTYGLTIDNLIEVDVVLADGRLVTASETEYPDLFWAMRGGGGNFGVVTSFLFRLHPVDTVVAGPTLWPMERAEEILRWYRDFIPAAPTDLNGWFAFLTVPPAAPFPESLHLQQMCGIVWCYTGPAERAGTSSHPSGRQPRRSTASRNCPSQRYRAPSTRSTRRASSGTGSRTSSKSFPTRQSPATSPTAPGFQPSTRQCTSTRSMAPSTASDRMRRRLLSVTPAGWE